MLVWNSKLLKEALRTDVPENIEASIVQFNSSDVSEGNLFIALQGEKGNGHDYALDAYKRGAGLLILEKQIEGIPEDKTIIVKDTNEALSSLAIYKRSHTKATIIAITGSAGKTSTRDWLRATLDNFGKCYSSRGSFNNILGVRLELASLPTELDYGILEVGMNHGGEIRELIGYVKPNIAMINNVLPSHIGNFDNLQGIADAKSEIFESMSENGIAILNKSNEFFDYCRDKALDNGIREIYSFGDNVSDSDSNLAKYDMEDKHIIHIGGKDISFEAGISGRHRILNLAPVLLICKILNLNIEEAAKSFKNISEPTGRGKISKVKYQDYNITIIDDSYNAAPPAMVASLSCLSDFKAAYKVAIIGDMKELGKEEIKYHQDLLPYVSNIDKLHCVGPLMKHLYDILPTEIKGFYFETHEDLQINLKDVIDKDMIVLFKAANGMKLWKVVQNLLK